MVRYVSRKGSHLKQRIILHRPTKQSANVHDVYTPPDALLRGPRIGERLFPRTVLEDFAAVRTSLRGPLCSDGFRLWGRRFLAARSDFPLRLCHRLSLRTNYDSDIATERMECRIVLIEASRMVQPK